MKRDKPVQASSGIVIACLFLALIPARARAGDLRQLIAAGDAIYQATITGHGKTAEALARYEAALRLQPDHYEALCKATAMLYYLGLESGNRQERLKFHGQGIAYARKAIAINPAGAHGHFWLGVHYGKYGEARGVIKSLFLVDDIKEEMRRVIALDETYAKASAYTVLGRLYFLVPGIFGGSNKKAVALLEKGRRLAPDNTTTLLFLAEVYWDEGRREAARGVLRELLSLPQTADVVREFFLDREAARRLLARYENER